MKSNNCYYYQDRPQHVYNALKRFPEVRVSRKDVEINIKNKEAMKATISKSISKETKKNAKNVDALVDARVNSEKIFMEDQLLHTLCNSEDLNGMHDVTTSIVNRRIDERKRALNQRMSYLKPVPLKEANLSKAAGGNIRPNTSGSSVKDRPAVGQPTLSPKAATQTITASVTPRNAANDDRETLSPPPPPLMTGIMLMSEASPPSSSQRRRQPMVRSPFKPNPINRLDLDSICAKLAQAGFHFYNGDDAATSILECGLLTVLNGSDRSNRYVAEASEMNRLDLQSRLLLVLGVRLTDSETSSLHSLLLKHRVQR